MPGYGSPEKAFVMSAYSYDTNTNTSARYEDTPAVMKNTSFRAVLPAPTGGFVLNESGNWEETEGLMDLTGDLTRIGLSAMKGLSGIAGKHLVKGKFVNDYASLSYNGSEFRTWSFSWDLMYNSAKEAKEIFDVINNIRRKALPSYKGPVVEYPFWWKVYPLANNINAVGLHLQDCVITSVEVNYSPDGVMQLHTSNHPTKIEFSISFKELYRADARDII